MVMRLVVSPGLYLEPVSTPLANSGKSGDEQRSD
jgi:hypothetical protein